MADPVTLLCSILTIADASKKVSDVCTYYISHAKNAPKELQTITDDLSALTKTIRKLDQLAKSVLKDDATAKQLSEWDVPLRRLNGYTENLSNLINRQDMKIGLFHEIAFRTRWPSAWKEARGLLGDISFEKHNLHLETTIYGV
jgi:Zn-dependent oligopeptidase